MARFELSHKSLLNGPFDFQLNVKSISEMPAGQSVEMQSEPFTWIGYPEVSTRAKLHLKAVDRALYASLRVDQPGAISALRGLKHFPAIYYALKNVSGSGVDHIVCGNRLFGWDPVQFLHCKNFKLISGSGLAHPTYNKDDTAVIQVYVEPPAMAQRVYSYEGILNWSIENFSKRKQRGLVMLFGEESPYFFTGPSGYRVRVFVRPMPNVLRLFVYFCAGEFDQNLARSFPHCTTVTLLHRSNPERNVLKRTKRNIDICPAYFVDIRLNHEVEQLLEDDTLFYSVSIRPTLN